MNAVKGLFGGGGGDNGLQERIAAQQQEQARLQAGEKNRLDLQEQAARKVRGAGGRRGLLSFVDDALGTKLGG